MLKKLHAALLFLLLASPLIFSFHPEANRFEILRAVGPLLALGIGVLLWLFTRGIQKNSQPTNLPLLLMLLGFGVFSTLSWMLSDIHSFGFAEVFVLWICFLVYLPFSQEKTWSSKVTLALGLTLVFATLIGIKGYLSTDHTRFFGFFYDPLIKADAWPNAYADFFLMSFPFFALHFWKKDSNRPVSVLLTALVLAGFVLTASRGAFLALIPALAFLAAAALFHSPHLPSLKKTKHAALILLFVALLTVGFVKGLTSLKNQNYTAVDLGSRLTFTEAEGGNSFSERLQFFEGALLMVQEEPLFGTGPSSFKFAYQPYQQGFLALSDHPHNVWLKLAAERGLPAALCLLAFLGYVFFKTSPFRKDVDRPFTLAAWTGLLALLAHSMIDYNLNFVTNALTFWFILGALASQMPKQKTRLTPVALLVLGFLVATSGLKLAVDELSFNRLSTLEQVQAFHPLLPSYEWTEKISTTEDPVLKAAYLQKQLDANPMDADARSLLGQEKEKEGDLQGARSAYQTATEVSPKNTFAHYLALVKILKLQNDGAALEALSQQLAPLFEEYQKLYDANLHFTQSSNEMQNMEELKAILLIPA